MILSTAALMFKSQSVICPSDLPQIILSEFSGYMEKDLAADGCLIYDAKIWPLFRRK